MKAKPYTDKEIELANKWLAAASRYMALLGGNAKTCKQRPCKRAKRCQADALHPNRTKNACGKKLQKHEVWLVTQMALFGALHEAGILDIQKELHA